MNWPRLRPTECKDEGKCSQNVKMEKCQWERKGLCFACGGTAERLVVSHRKLR